MTSSERSWRVDSHEAGERLDLHIAGRLGVARSQVQIWIRQRAVSWDSPKKVKASATVDDGLEITCAVPAPEADPELVAEAGDLGLLYEDDHLVVINKPAGLAVHPGAGRPRGTLVNRLLHRYPELATLGGKGRPGIVHRLDLDTTGALVVARREETMRALQAAFADRQVSKTYLAIVHGVPKDTEGLVDAPIGRHPQDRKRMTVRRDGRPARTGFRILGSVTERQRVAAALEVDLQTGRTHQIRVHMKSMGHPLIGDPTYGEARWRGAPTTHKKTLATFQRTALHAWRLAFSHPATGEAISFAAPIPDDLEDLWRRLGGSALEPG